MDLHAEILKLKLAANELFDNHEDELSETKFGGELAYDKVTDILSLCEELEYIYDHYNDEKSSHGKPVIPHYGTMSKSQQGVR